MDFPMSSFGGMTRVSHRAVPDPSALPFGVYLPPTADAPMAVFVSQPSAYPKGEAEVVAEYDSTSPYGAFRIREYARRPQAGDAGGDAERVDVLRNERRFVHKHVDPPPARRGGCTPVRPRRSDQRHLVGAFR